MTSALFFRAVMIAGLAYVAYRGFREAKTGAVRISNKLPGVIIRRSESPITYWTYLAFSYSLIVGLIVLALLGRFPR